MKKTTLTNLTSKRLLAAVATATFAAAALTVAPEATPAASAQTNQSSQDPIGALVYGAYSGSTNALQANVGATVFASMYSTQHLAPAQQFSGAAGVAQRCADTVTLSSNDGYTRYLAAMGCVLVNPPLAAQIDAQFRQNGHFF